MKEICKIALSVALYKFFNQKILPIQAEHISMTALGDMSFCLLTKAGHIAMVSFASLPFLIFRTGVSNQIFNMKEIGKMAIHSTTIACLGMVLDKLFNQNYIPSKPLQYLAIIAEGIAYGNIYSGYMISSGAWNQLGRKIFNIIVSTAIVQALALKYIWDQDSNATDDITTPELDLVEIDEDSTNTIFDSVDQTADISVELNKWSFTNYFRNLFSNTTDSISIDEVDISVEPSILSSINTFGSYCKNICNDMSIQLMGLSTRLKSYIWDQDSNATDDIATPELDLVEIDEDSTNTIFDSVDQTADISVEPSILSSINTFGSYSKNICNDMFIQLMGLSTRLKSYIWDQDSNATDDIATPELDLVEMDSL
jgi:hypothetical protein